LEFVTTAVYVVELVGLAITVKAEVLLNPVDGVHWIFVPESLLTLKETEVFPVHIIESPEIEKSGIGLTVNIFARVSVQPLPSFATSLTLFPPVLPKRILLKL
jgi:hypothetical protein